MADLLDTIRAEIAPLEQRLGVLREMEALAVVLNGADLDGGGEGASSPDADRSLAEAIDGHEADALPAGRDAATPDADHSVGATEEKPPEPAAPTALNGSGSAPSGVDGRAPGPPNPRSAKGGRAREARIVAAIRELQPASVAAIAKALGDKSANLTVPLRRLRDAGTVIAEGERAARRYSLTADRDHQVASRSQARKTAASVPLAQLKRQVLDLIARDPDSLTEDRLAQALHVDREDIAVACGELLEDNEIRLQPEGTYIVDRGGGPSNREHRADHDRDRRDGRPGRRPRRHRRAHLPVTEELPAARRRRRRGAGRAGRHRHAARHLPCRERRRRLRDLQGARR